MSEACLLLIRENGQTRSLLGSGLLSPLPDSLIWGPESIDRLEANYRLTEVWPDEFQIVGAAVIDRDAGQLVFAGANIGTFANAYQLELFARLLVARWNGYRVSQVDVSSQAIAEAANIEIPPIDRKAAYEVLREAFALDPELDEELDDDYLQDEVNGEDFRALTRRVPPEASDSQTARHAQAEAMREWEDRDWWVSVRDEGVDKFSHYQGDFFLQTLEQSGPSLLSKIRQFGESDPPKERDCSRGIVLDANAHTLFIWSHPRGTPAWLNLKDEQWASWSLERWSSNGYRRQLELTGQTDRIVTDTDIRSLSGFVPDLVEQLNMDEMFESIKSGFKGLVRKTFGCLAFFLAIPAAITAAITGGWKAPFAFAATLWVLAFFAYLWFARKMKKQFEPLSQMQAQQQSGFTSVAPDEVEQRIEIIDQALVFAGLPNYQQVSEYAQSYDEDDDGEPVDPIVEISGERYERSAAIKRRT